MRQKPLKKMRYTRNKIRIKRKNKTRIQKIKGGFLIEPEPVIDIPYSLDLTESINTALAPIFRVLPKFSKDLVYISFGSKLNEKYLDSRDRYNNAVSDLNRNVNAGFQMVPFFLCANSHPRQDLLCNGMPCQVLNIVIDIFKDGIEESVNYINETLNRKEPKLDTSNITQYFINISNVYNGIVDDAMKKNIREPYTVNEHFSFLGILADTFCKKMKENEIQPENFMVCNYIKFKNPEHNKNIIDGVSNELSTVMNRNGYENSYYEWCGYKHMVFYNCIILKKDMHIIETAFDRYENIFKEKLSNEDLKIFDLKKSDFNTKKYDLLKKFYPIQNPNYLFNYSLDEEKNNNFCYSVYNLLF
jgi:hypothetical protein